MCLVVYVYTTVHKHHSELGEPKLAAGDDDGAPADLDAVDVLRRSLGARVEARGPLDLGALLDGRFADARFPFRHDRLVPRITVLGTVGDVSLEAGRRARTHWPEADKRALLQRGYDLADRELSANGYPAVEVVSS